MTDIFAPDSPCVSRVAASPNFNERKLKRKPDLVVLHYTGMDDARKAVNRLCDPDAEVSAHYFVFESGEILQLVPEGKRAWHAGAGEWDHVTDINSCSIGIEIDNRGHNYPDRDSEPPDYPDIQIQSVIRLVADILERCRIDPVRVVGHSDIAPERKADPGEKFPWERLYRSGIGLWADSVPVYKNKAIKYGDCGEDIQMLLMKLHAIGYKKLVTNCFNEDLFQQIIAFQRHFNCEKVDGIADAKTLAILEKLYQVKQNKVI